MSMPTEHVEALHQITAELKAEHARRDAWMHEIAEEHGFKGDADGSRGSRNLTVTRAEAERIFADRIAAHEGKLKELGWSRTIRVEAEATERERRNEHILAVAKAI